MALAELPHKMVDRDEDGKDDPTGIKNQLQSAFLDIRSAIATLFKAVDDWYHRRSWLGKVTISILAALLIRETYRIIRPYLAVVIDGFSAVIDILRAFELTLGFLLYLILLVVYLNFTVTVLILIELRRRKNGMDDSGLAPDGGSQDPDFQWQPNQEVEEVEEIGGASDQKEGIIHSNWFWWINVIAFAFIFGALGASISDIAGWIGLAVGFTIGNELTRYMRSFDPIKRQNHSESGRIL